MNLPQSDTPLELHTLSVGSWHVNCYVLADSATKEALLIDPGDEANRILNWIMGFNIQSILLTHAHFDHVGALAEVRAALGVPVGLHPDDVGLAASYGVERDFDLNDGDAIPLAGRQIVVAHTPGHTAGSISLRFDRRAIVGDAIFPGGPGRTNTPEELKLSLEILKRTVFTWPDETELYPGHGISTTVGKERPGFEALVSRPLPTDLYGDVTW